MFERYERGVMEEVVDAHETGECVFSAQASARASRVITQKKKTLYKLVENTAENNELNGICGSVC